MAGLLTRASLTLVKDARLSVTGKPHSTAQTENQRLPLSLVILAAIITAGIIPLAKGEVSNEAVIYEAGPVCRSTMVIEKESGLWGFMLFKLLMVVFGLGVAAGGIIAVWLSRRSTRVEQRQPTPHSTTRARSATTGTRPTKSPATSTSRTVATQSQTTYRRDLAQCRFQFLVEREQGCWPEAGR